MAVQSIHDTRTQHIQSIISNVSTPIFLGRSKTPHRPASPLHASSLPNTPPPLLARLQSRLPFLYYIEIWKRLVITISLMSLIFFVYTHIPLPAVDQAAVPQHFYLLPPGTELASPSSIRLLPAHIFMLGISPFITSSLLVSISAKMAEASKELKEIICSIPLLGGAVASYLAGKEEGKAGEGTIKRAIRQFSLPCMLLEASYLAFDMRRYLVPSALHVPQPDWPFSIPLSLLNFELYTTLTLMAGAACVEKMATDITDHGIGDGSLTIICFEIVLQLYHSLVNFVTSFLHHEVGWGGVGSVTAGLVVAAGVAAFLNGAADRIPLTYYKSSKLRSSELIGYRPDPYLPLKWLPQGVLPILFSNIVLITLPSVLLSSIPTLAPSLQSYLTFMTTHPLAAVLLGAVVGGMQAVVYVGASPQDMSKQMAAVGARIPGVRPGEDTLLALKARIRAASVKGGVALALTATLSKWLDLWLAATVGGSLSTTSMLLVASLVAGASRQVRALMQRPKLARALRLG